MKKNSKEFLDSTSFLSIHKYLPIFTMASSSIDDPNDWNAIRYALQSSGVDISESNPQRSGVRTRGYLPHVRREGAHYFVTFRLGDSLPREFVQEAARKLTQEKARILSTMDQAKGALANKELKAEVERLEDDYHRKIERQLDQGIGDCHLRRPDLAELVANALRCFDGQRYHLGAWVIMPNHVHAIVWPLPNHLLSDILKSWKGFTARLANQKLGQVGRRFWQPESFDRWIRDETELSRFNSYIVNNPVKARLCRTPQEWRWSSEWNGIKSVN